MDETGADAPNAGKGGAGDQNAAVGSNELLVELARRLLSWRFQGYPGAGTVTLLPGEVPAEVLAEVPLPEDSRIIGSVVLPTHVTTVVESSMEPGQIESFYKQRMAAAGWTQPDPWPGTGWGGFQHNLMESAMGTIFCRGPRGPELRVQSFHDQGSPTEVRLYYNTDARNSTCAQSRRGRMPANMWAEIIPDLSAPSGSLQMPRSGGSSNTAQRETSALLKADLDLATVVAHYGEQLKAAGWQQQESGENGPMAWRTYAFRDEEGEDWNALFYVLALPKKEGVYHLFVQASIAGLEERYPGGFAFS